MNTFVFTPPTFDVAIRDFDDIVLVAPSERLEPAFNLRDRLIDLGLFEVGVDEGGVETVDLMSL